MRYGNIKLAKINRVRFTSIRRAGVYFLQGILWRDSKTLSKTNTNTSMCDSLGSVALYQAKTNRNRKVNRALLAFIIVWD